MQNYNVLLHMYHAVQSHMYLRLVFKCMKTVDCLD